MKASRNVFPADPGQEGPVPNVPAADEVSIPQTAAVHNATVVALLHVATRVVVG